MYIIDAAQLSSPRGLRKPMQQVLHGPLSVRYLHAYEIHVLVAWNTTHVLQELYCTELTLCNERVPLHFFARGPRGLAPFDRTGIMKKCCCQFKVERSSISVSLQCPQGKMGAKLTVQYCTALLIREKDETALKKTETKIYMYIGIPKRNAQSQRKKKRFI